MKEHYTGYHSSFNVSELKEFDLMLVSRFETEISNSRPDKGAVYQLIHTANQYQDMLNGYLYAQNICLASIRKKSIAAISPEELSHWINQIHQRIAHGIALDAKNSECVAGQYTSKQIYRWHYTVRLHDLIFNYFSKSLSKKKLQKDAVKLGCNLKDFNEFICLLEAIHMRLKKTSKKLGSPLENISEDIAARFHGKQGIPLTPQEQKIIPKFVKISTDPEQIPKKMQNFLAELIDKWRKCEANDINSIVDLAHFAFYQLTEIHPYFNCNGRTATCLLNIILRSFGQPSILLRLPGERHDQKSDYSQAIAGINSQPALLKKLIQQRIEANDPQQDDVSAQALICRIKLAAALRYLMTQIPEEKLDRQYEQKQCEIFDDKEVNSLISQARDFLNAEEPAVPELPAKPLLNKCNQLIKLYYDEITDVKDIENYLNLVLFNRLVTYFTELAEQLKKPATHNALAALSVVNKPEEKAKTIKSKLCSLTQQSDWKAFKRATIFLLNLNDKDLANNLVTRLQETGALNVKLMFTKDEDRKPVVQVTDINWPKLQKVSSLGLSPPAPTHSPA